jgi:glycosyltransferase involved in cell wall biosynthesis
MKPYFSIVIPTLNEELYLPKLLDSLSTQTDQDFEVVVVDGLSADRTVHLVERATVPFSLHLIRHKAPNVAAQRNHGAKEVSGEYIIFFDADVSIGPDFLAKLRELIYRKKIDFASPLISLDTNFWFDRITEAWVNASMRILTKLGRACMSGQAFIVKREIFEKVGGFDPEIIHGEDFELSYRIARAGFFGQMLKDLTVIVSARRYERDGRFILFLKQLKATAHMLFVGPIRKNLFEYRMGGAVEK